MTEVLRWVGMFVEGLWCARVPLEGSADQGFPWCVQPCSPQPHRVSPCVSGFWPASLSPLHQQQLTWTRLVLEGCWAVGQSLGHPADVCEPAAFLHRPDMLPGNWNGFRSSLWALLSWVCHCKSSFIEVNEQEDSQPGLWAGSPVWCSTQGRNVFELNLGYLCF